MAELSAWFVPLCVAGILIFSLCKGVAVFSEFIAGAKEGAKNSAEILPSLIGLITAVTMLRESGALELLGKALQPVVEWLGIPGEIVPMILLRPISGGGSIALLENLIKTYGADSFAGRVASVMAGSTETTFYTIAVYFGAVQVKKTRYTLPSALTADFACTALSISFVRLLFPAG